MRNKLVSKAQFMGALTAIGLLGGRRRALLQAHFSSPGRTSTFTNLAEAVGYENYRAVNLQYGLLARRIGDALGRENADVSLLLEFNEPASLTNEQWIASMRPEFAEALKELRWVK